MSFTTWFEDELPGTGILKAYYEDYDNWNGGIYYLGIDFEKEYRLHYGIDYSDILKLEVPQMEDIKMFIELARYASCRWLHHIKTLFTLKKCCDHKAFCKQKRKGYI